ncbi:hypothetical protein U9M48_011543 [Paspalum notatum var. saurae]|uniref:Uncharacterized protein n=1 Tax=Paspalum notatum var. saurae TaxID=547442 RepID=A0AAQ3SWJ3_PASNO
MGQCVSTSGTDSAAPPPTTRDTGALVLMPGGDLREYARGATAARPLHDAAAGTHDAQAAKWCVCDADAVGLAEGPVPALAAADALRAGQIYFVLPAAARRRGVRRQDVAALAVAASAALSARAAAAASGRRGGGRRGAAVAPLVFAPPPEEEATDAAPQKPSPKPKRRPAGSCSGGRVERFASGLTAIPE